MSSPPTRPHHRRLPSNPDDYDWDMCSEILFEDHDILLLYDEQFDGVEDPDAKLNQQFRINDLRSASWFNPSTTSPHASSVAARPASCDPAPRRVVSGGWSPSRGHS